MADPLCRRFQCECVKEIAGREYEKLAEFIERHLNRPVTLAFSENVAEVIRLNPGRADVIIGPREAVLFDVGKSGTDVRAIAMLTDRFDRTVSAGLLVVRRDDPARELGDLGGRAVLLGPEWAPQTHLNALAALTAAGVSPGRPVPSADSGADALFDLIENKADAAVVADYELPVLVKRNFDGNAPFRVVGRTEPVPFVTVFVTSRISEGCEAAILKSLLAVREEAGLLSALQSKSGFVKAAFSPRLPKGLVEWTDWRGPERKAVSAYVPAKLPARPRVLWSKRLTGPAWSGLAVTRDRVIVADKGKQGREDIWRCLDADTGKQLWDLRYQAEKEMDYTSAPRATPVIHGGLAYLLGALGDLHCARLADGNVVWKMNIFRDFGAEPIQWGASATPLLVDGKLIVNPGAKDASLVALEARTGQVLWKTPGAPGAYSSFIVGTFGGRRQVVGYDCVALAGYDPNSGRRLWELIPPVEGDFNVPTPIEVDGKLLVTSENNGTRLYGFDSQGKIKPKPLAVNTDLSPDTSTPVVLDGMVFGCWNGLYCLDLAGGLRTLWRAENKAYEDYTVLIAGNGRVLITATTGELLLVKADREGYQLVSRLQPFDSEAELLSHPALIGNRLYIRSAEQVRCVLMGPG
ncbi:MAG TPA: PQQ-binding-like beta-propeller repeat protein [Phycisphaerae bacterium]|nr:PQQ-binding-like beta-propeller repeat protein [Phycisphaerae bacterium]